MTCALCLENFREEAFLGREFKSMAFLISPMGLPLAAIWLLGKVQDLKYAIQDRVYGGFHGLYRRSYHVRYYVWYHVRCDST